MSALLTVTHKAIGVEVRRSPYDVLLDGETVGTVTMNDSLVLPIEAGQHSLQLRSGRNSSRIKAFTAEDGGAIAFRCTGKSLLPVFLLSFLVHGLALTLVRE